MEIPKWAMKDLSNKFEFEPEKKELIKPKENPWFIYLIFSIILLGLIGYSLLLVLRTIVRFSLS